MCDMISLSGCFSLILNFSYVSIFIVLKQFWENDHVLTQLHVFKSRDVEYNGGDDM